MEARRVTAKNQIVRDLTPGEVMIVASRSDWHSLLLDLGWAEREGDALGLEPPTYKLIEILRGMEL